MGGYADSDAEERAELTWQLQDDLSRSGVGDVDRPEARAPTGAKGAALEWAQLVVTLAGSMPALVTAVRGWLGRHPGASITLEIQGDQLKLESPTARQQQDLIDAWIARHGG